MKKALCVLLAAAVLFSLLALPASAAVSVEPQVNKGLNKDTAKGIAQNLVDVVQGVFGIAAVVFVIWAGVMFWGAHGDAQKIAHAKRAFAGFVVAMVCVFFADKIVGGLLGIFGVGK